MTTTTTYKHSSARSGTSLLGRVLDKIGRHLLRRRAHAALANLDDRMLRDIGLSRAEVERLVQRG